MSVDKQRIVDAIRGAFVADAASMGTHWIYDPNEMRSTVSSVDSPEFKDPPEPRYYSSNEFPGHYGRGMLSPYGEQLLFVTEYAAAGGKVVNGDMSRAMKVWAETFGGRRDGATNDFLKCTVSGAKPNCGADDDQAHCFTKAVPITCLYAGKPERRAKVEEAIRVHQENDAAVAYGLALSNVLEAVLLGAPLEKALEKASDGISLQKVSGAVRMARDVAGKGRTLDETAAEIGRSCHLPEAFVIPMQAAFGSLVSSDSAGGHYVKAVRDNILASGDTCSRGIAIGAILGAAYGGPPKGWVAKFDGGQAAKVDAAASKIANWATTTTAGGDVSKPSVGGNGSPAVPSDLKNAARALRSAVALEDRRYRLKTYPKCFVGSDAVSILVAEGYAKTREDAVVIGRRLQTELHLFVHVAKDHDFEDEGYFYEFLDASGKPADRRECAWTDSLHL